MQTSNKIISSHTRLLTRREAAAYLSICERKLDQLAASGQIVRVKIDTAVRFDPEDLKAFADAHKQGRSL